MRGAQFRKRRKALGLSQGAVGQAAGGITDATVRKLEKGEHISSAYVARLWSALADLEAAAANPSPPAPTAEEQALRAVLDELRAFRRLYEDDRALTERLAVQIEALAARIGPAQ